MTRLRRATTVPVFQGTKTWSLSVGRQKRRSKKMLRISESWLWGYWKQFPNYLWIYFTFKFLTSLPCKSTWFGICILFEFKGTQYMGALTNGSTFFDKYSIFSSLPIDLCKLLLKLHPVPISWHYSSVKQNYQPPTKITFSIYSRICAVTHTYLLVLTF